MSMNTTLCPTCASPVYVTTESNRRDDVTMYYSPIVTDWLLASCLDFLNALRAEWSGKEHSDNVAKLKDLDHTMRVAREVLRAIDKMKKEVI